LKVFDYLEAKIQVVHHFASIDDVFVPSSDFDNPGAAPNTLNVVWVDVQP